MRHGEGGEHMDKFNENVEMMCAKRGVSKKSLIDHLGISRSAFYAKLAGARPWFLEEAVGIAAFFGCSINDLVS